MYSLYKKRRADGFTLVEIIIIIGILGILVTMGGFGWGSLTTWSQNNTRGGELQQWASAFDLYKSRFSTFPYMPASAGTEYYCLGTFTKTSNKCGEYTFAVGSKTFDASSANTNGTSILTELGKVGNVPTNTAPDIDKLAIGPYVQFVNTDMGGGVTKLDVKIIALLKDNKCPADTIKETPASLPVAATLTQVVSCSISKTMTYGP